MSGAASLGAGLALVRARLARRSALVAVVTAAGAGAVIAAVARADRAYGAADRALGPVVHLLVPLLCLALTSLACAGAGFTESVSCLARHGASRRALAAGVALGAVVGCAAGSLLVVEAAVLVAHGGSPGGDAVTSGWIAALGGAAYGSALLLGARALRRGRGRYVVAALDLALGASAGPWALAFPRAHLANLMGAPAPLGLSQPASSVVLGLMALALGLVAVLATRD